MTDHELQVSTINRFLGRHTTMSLATCQGNRPWSTDLFYASDEDCRLIFISDVKTLHCRHIAANPRVSVSISEQCSDWNEIKGMQIDGVAGVVSEEDREAVTEIYLAKFPALRNLHRASRIFRLFRESSFYRVSPNWIRLIDNSKGFGKKRARIFNEETGPV